MTKTSLLEVPRVVHSSFSSFPASKNQLFPVNPPGAGVIVRVGYHPREKKVIADIYMEIPSISSPGKGEFYSLEEDLNKLTRAKIFEIINQCDELIAQLEKQKTRLEQIGLSDNLIDDFDSDRIEKSATKGLTVPITSVSPKISQKDQTYIPIRQQVRERDMNKVDVGGIANLAGNLLAKFKKEEK